MANEETQAKWYQKRGLMWIFLFFIPPIGLIMLFLNRENCPAWKKIALLGIIWTLILAVSSASKHTPNPPNQPQTQTTIATSESPQKQPPAPKEQIYNIGLTNADFDSRFATVSQQILGYHIDPSHGEFSSGEKRDVSTLKTNDGVVLQKWINKDKTLNAILIIANINENSAGSFIVYAGLVMMTIQPDMSAEDRKILMNKLITPPKGENEFTNKVANKDILYTLTLSKQTILLSASNKKE